MRGLKLKDEYDFEINRLSHLLQMRGLKHLLYKYPERKLPSHLLQMRGLKPNVGQYYQIEVKSHLLQMRGLKPGERK